MSEETKRSVQVKFNHVGITVSKLGESTYSLDPFPFAADTLTLTCRGRYVHPYPPGHEPADLGATLRALPPDVQTFKLVPRH